MKDLGRMLVNSTFHCVHIYLFIYFLLYNKETAKLVIIALLKKTCTPLTGRCNNRLSILVQYMSSAMCCSHKTQHDIVKVVENILVNMYIRLTFEPLLSGFCQC